MSLTSSIFTLQTSVKTRGGSEVASVSVIFAWRTMNP